MLDKQCHLIYIQLKNCNKNPYNIYYIGGYVLWRKIFSEEIYHRELFCFLKCFMVIPNHLLNQLLLIIWPYCDKYTEFIVNILKKTTTLLVISKN